MSYYAKCSSYVGSVESDENLLDTLGDVRIIGFTLVSDAFTQINLGNDSEVTTYLMGDNYIVNLPPATTDTGVYINELTFSDSCNITLNYFYEENSLLGGTYMSYIAAGVGKIELYSNVGDLILTSKTLTESGISVDVTTEDIRGGMNAPLIGRYFHSSNFSLTLTDALFNLQYLALNMGGQIKVGGENFVEEQITTTVTNSITVTGTPIVWNGLGTIGWYSVAGANNWKKITFTGQTAAVTGLPTGTKVCVRYNVTDGALREFTIPATIIPAECYALLTVPLFPAGADGQKLTNSSKAGHLVIKLPRFQLNGTQEFNLTMSGAATSNLSGSALVNYTGLDSCESDGYYGIIQEVIIGRTPETGLMTVAIAGAGALMTMERNSTLKLVVMGIYEDGSTGVLDNTRLTFTVTPTATATVATNGTVTAGSTAGTGTLKVVVTNKNDIETYGQIVVS